MEEVKKKEHPSPRATANPISKLLFFWTRKIFCKGFKKDLVEDDLYNILENDKTNTLGDKLEENWKKEMLLAKQKGRDPSLQRAIVKTFWKQYIMCFLLAAISFLVIRVAQTLLMGKVILYFTPHTTIKTSDAQIYGGLMVVVIFVRLAFDHHYNHRCFNLGMRIRVACCSLIYRKLLRLSKASTDQTATGRVVNLMSNDVCRFDYAPQTIGFLVITPLQVIIIIYCLWLYVGVSSLVGVTCLFLQTLPVQSYLGRLIAQLRKQVAHLTDDRMRLMNEIVSGIQVIKMYAWEMPFAKLVDIARRKEIAKVTLSSYLRGFYLSSMVYLERSSLFATLLSYALMGFHITPEKVFTMAQFYNNLNQTMAIMFPTAVEFKAESSVSISRLQELMMEKEAECAPTYIHKDKLHNGVAAEVIGSRTVAANGISLNNANARWSSEPGTDNLRNITFRVPPGKLCAIIGPVGSGKSSLLYAIMQELPLSCGTLSVGGSISYASQEPWLFVGTVRQNILFGQPYNAEKYKEVVRVCALQKDFELFSHGDKTLVGEKGISLSGGQRARINLARAVYRSADVYLLDDPLSAVDTHVGKHLFDECIKTHLSGKTRVLVTHQLQYIKDADLIIIFNNGTIENMGTYSEMQSSGLNFAKLLAAMEEERAKFEEEEEIAIKPGLRSRQASERSLNMEGEGVLRRRSIKRHSTRRSLKKEASFRSSFNSDDYHNTLRRSMIKRHMRQPSLISASSSKSLKKFSYTKRLSDTTLSMPGIKPIISKNLLWPGSRRVRAWLKKVLRLHSLQSCWTSMVVEVHQGRPPRRESSSDSSRSTSPIRNRYSWFGDDMDEEPDEEAVKETQSVGSVSWSLYWKYFRAGGNICFFFLTFFTLVLAQAFTTGADNWVTFWTEEEVERDTIRMSHGLPMNATIPEDIDPTLFNTEDSLIIYGCLIAGCMFITLLRSILFVKLCMRASVRLHNTMFSSIIRGAMRFFDTNPSGRILNRFSKDIGAIDELLPRFMLESIQVFLVLIGILVNIAIVNTYFIAPMAVLGLCYYGVTVVYLRTSRNVKRLEGITRSPVYSHLSDTMTGLTTIRVSGAQEMVRKAFDSRQDDHSAAWSLFISTSNAFGFWMDILSSLFVAIITLTFFLAGAENIGAKVGLALSQALIVTGMLQYGLLRVTEVVSQMTAVERVLEYTNIEKEPELESAPDKKPPDSWPEQGRIQFQKMYLKYGDDQSFVLKNLNFTIEPMHKVGIVGRTGAGKSSLISALFRLAKLEGAVVIDGRNTNELGLHDLRTRISIIPQEPVLFSATLRHNLDPFKQYPDDALWSALEEVDLKSCVSGLEMQVSEGGSNFSVGQRQLVCLARAILRNNKILVLDEATANVDPETDTFVQETIRRKFKYCTVLTIAHRLNTIMDSDRVLVMDAGSMVEYDHPHLLLQRKHGHFYKLVQETGPAMADQLTRIAEKSYLATMAKEVIPEQESTDESTNL